MLQSSNMLKFTVQFGLIILLEDYKSLNQTCTGDFGEGMVELVCRIYINYDFD